MLCLDKQRDGVCVDINGPQDEEDDKGKGAANECGRDVELGSLCVNHADQRNSRNGTQIQRFAKRP